MPLGISVTALSALAAYDGERSLHAAAAAGIPYMIGSTNFTPQKDIRRSAAIWRGARSIRPSAVTCSVATWPMRVRPAVCSCRRWIPR